MHHLLVDPEPRVPLYAVLPFVGILLSIALLPLIHGRWWSRHYGKVALLWGLPAAVYVAWKLDPRWLAHTAFEYVAFLTLLGSLFVISGGILLRGSLAGSPGVNAGLLLAGATLANLIGTTGASMLLIRPLLRANAWRKHRKHTVIFFIFLVSNIGGSLTPLGDPPLYLGFLRGVPFEWTLRLAPLWATAVAIVLALYLALDARLYRSEEPGARPAPEEPLGIAGGRNFLWLAGVLVAVLASPKLPAPWGTVAAVIVVSGLAALSLRFTEPAIRTGNGFTWHPIQEVAILFAGIFACMIPALKLLEQRGGELGVSEPWQFFWMTGSLSSFLDNAPTYLTFLSLAKTIDRPPFVELLGGEGHVNATLLLAISAGAVFMGANSYIGNGPNFMVKAVAEDAGVRMPSFFGYMAYSALVLLPVFALITVIFF
jgi:Na+/H+ antiporter NhaD/arsenite permease-like protein